MKKSLIETNPYLKDPKALKEAVAKHVRDSSAIEGICVPRTSSSTKTTKKAVKDNKR